MASSDSPGDHTPSSPRTSNVSLARAEATAAVDVVVISVLNVVARYLPISAGPACARGFGRLLSLLPNARTRRRMIEYALPDRDDHARIAREYATRMPLDHVRLAQLAAGRDIGTHVAPIEHRMSRQTRELFDSERSIMIAAGHFSMESMSYALAPSSIDRKQTVAAAPVTTDAPLFQRNLHRLIQRAQIDGYCALTGATVLERGQRGLVAHMISDLKQPGHMGFLSIDAPIPATSTRKVLERPYAGLISRKFATGVGLVAQRTQAPTVVLAAHRDGERLVAQWSDPIPPPPPRNSAAADDNVTTFAFTSRLLDILEREVGRHPGSFDLDIGSERRWDSIAERWVGPDEPQPSRWS